MKKRLASTLLLIIYVLTLLASTGNAIDTEPQLTSNYYRTYTFNVEHGNYRSAFTLHTFVPPSLYHFYCSETHSVNSERDYAKFVTPGAFITIAENIRKITTKSPNSDEEFANNVLALVRQIPYSVSACKYPVEAIVDNSGDCDVTSFLAASIMKAGGLDVVLLIYRGLPGTHMNVAVYLPREPFNTPLETDAVGFEYKNETYWVAECTPSGNWKVGVQPESFASVEPTIISLENNNESSPAFISSRSESPLTPSSISVTLSSENSSATEKERPLKISGSISPAHSGKRVVLYISQDRYSDKVFQTDIDEVGNYSLTWNVTSPGTYYIRTNLIPLSNYAGSDSELITFFADSYTPWIEENSPSYARGPSAKVYKTSSSKSAKEFLKSNLEGTNISLSGEFIILKNGQAITSSKQTITIPETVQTIVLRRQKIVLKMPEQTITVQGSEQSSNQFGFILQNNKGNFSTNVRLLNDSDVSQIEKQFSENNSTFMNVSQSIKENVWHHVVLKASASEITAELRDDNGILLKNLAVKTESANSSEYGILVSCTPDTFVAFKNIKVEDLDQQPNKSTSSIQVPERGLELFSPCIMLLTTIAIASIAFHYLRKERAKRCKKTE